MNKILITVVMLFSALFVSAEDMLQVVPFKAEPGATSADGLSFSISMNNATADIWAFQFDILLPEGMTLDDTGGLNPFELGDRCPHTIGRGGVKNFKHIVNYKLQDDGWWRVIVITTEADRIEGNSGEVLRAYYLTDTDFPEGIHPIYVRSTVLTVNGNYDIKTPNSSSYCYVGEEPFTKESSIDLSALSGYIPSWVAASIGDGLSVNKDFVGIDISGADSIGGKIVFPNKNALSFVKSGTKFNAEKIDGNIVECNDGFSCNKFSLYDGEYNLYVPQPIDCSTASFDRAFKAGYWSTVCLPFTLSSDKVQQLKDAGVIIEKLSSFDIKTGSITFEEVDEMLANTPYIIKCSKDMTPFTNVAINGIETTVSSTEVEVGDIAMLGVYSTTMLNSSSNLKYYVFDASNGNFVLVGINAKVMPFRSYIVVPGGVKLGRELKVNHSSGSHTLVNGITKDDDKVDVYSVDGNIVFKNVDAKSSLSELPTGVYVVGKKKIFVPRRK